MLDSPAKKISGKGKGGVDKKTTSANWFCQEVMLCAEKGRVRSLVKAVEELTTRR